MRETEFKYIDRGKLSLAVLIPGWGFDYRIFQTLDIEYNYLIPTRLDIDTFGSKLSENLRWAGATLIGWSLGGVLGASFTLKNPQLVKKAVFLGVPEKYNNETIKRMQALIEKDKVGYLEYFYKKCFQGQPARDKRWFDLMLKDIYLKRLDTGYLTGGLDYLKDNPLSLKELAALDKDVFFFRGTDDRIVSHDDFKGISEIVGRERSFEIEGQGHLPFFARRFREILDDII